MVMDIVPELLEKLQDDFDERIAQNSKLAKLEAKVRSGKATYGDASEYAETVGDLLQMSFAECIDAAQLPDEMMYYNIAERTVRPMLEKAHDMISKYAADVQTALNEKAGIGMRAVMPELNVDRIDGIVQRLSDGE